ncbi:MAG: 4-hydroxythreonine-4-phosphate dehydrogenase PdxA, partial [Candidatus Rokuibacteriota bacterium]
ELDGVVSMYHDPGRIALKLLGFERGVTVGGGLRGWRESGTGGMRGWE